jgi:hypothetical protein
MLKELICSLYQCRKVGACYYAWKFGSVINSSSSPLSAQEVKHYCLLLPQFYASSADHFLTSYEKSYTLIDNECNKMSLTKTVQLANSTITCTVDDEFHV